MRLPEGVAPAVTAVLEDCVNQLAVLGASRPGGAKGTANLEQVVGDEIAEIVEQQRELEVEYDLLLAKRQELQRQPGAAQELEANDEALKEVATKLKRSVAVLCKNLRMNPGTTENMMKMEEERRSTQELVEAALDEILEGGTFDSLVAGVEAELAKKEHVVATILREEENRRTIARLRKQLKDLLVSKETDILQKNEEIALLKDQRQEAKARTTMENKYIKKDAVVRVEMSQKKTERDQNSIRAEIAALRAKMEEEAAVHEEIVQFLKGAHVKLADKQEEWSQKFTDDTKAKDQELETLKDNRTRDRGRLRELTDQYKEYDKVIKSYHKKKRKQKEAAEYAVRSLAAAVRIQAWWRGMLVRHKLGPFKAGKKGKGGKKKGKGKGKGKGKKS